MIKIALSIMEKIFKLSKKCSVFQILRFILAPVFIRIFGDEYLKKHVELYEMFVKQKIIDFCLINHRDTVLDVGCGAGVLTDISEQGIGLDIVIPSGMETL